jgi:hypothetical protein
MMTPQVFEALTEVARSMEAYNAAIDSWIDELRLAGESPGRVNKLTGSAKAMRDSASIYLAWAQHLANGMPEETTEEVG